jgi:N-acetylglucosaminyldiphosphoundecaprenol N-acetyl-beta-D-mannosaminyltransferase
MNESNLITVDIDGIPVHAVNFGQTVGLIVSWAADDSGGYICTPNVDHVVMARRNRGFRAAILSARLRVPDGMGIVYGSRIAGTPLPATVTGRLLPAAVIRALIPRGMATAVYGGLPGVAERAASNLERDGGSVASVEAPMGLDVGSPADLASVEALRATGAKVVFVGLGAPKQELWMAAHAADLPGVVLVGVGAALDILAGRFRPAPGWMTRIGLEWAYRLAQEPRRLARRYLWDDPRFFMWALDARLRRRSARPDP